MAYIPAQIMRVLTTVLSAVVLSLALAAGAAAPAQAHDHSLGFGYRYGHLVTSADQVYDFHSPTVQYVGSVGGWLRFFTSIEIMIPTVGVQYGESWDLNSTYQSKFGTDISFGAALHFVPMNNLVVQTGLGPHMNAMTLSHEDLVTFNSLTLGLTSYSTARYTITNYVEAGVNLLFSVDFADPIHTAQGLSWGLHFAATAVIGVRLGEGDSPTLSPDLHDGPVRRDRQQHSHPEGDTGASSTEETGGAEPEGAAATGTGAPTAPAGYADAEPPEDATGADGEGPGESDADPEPTEEPPALPQGEQ